MDINSLGGGLAALAFWGFIAAVVVAGIWYGLRERQDKILGGNERPDRGLKIGGLITIFAAPGLAFLGWMLRTVDEHAFIALLGVSGLAAFVGAGLLVAGKFAERSLREDGIQGPR